ncbi:DgyrCDS12603 [Dimorphilus gyrociliatus]|uniref:DgyrCDS12603 n=1 Tax=Dimorphilus gyrociliatus TaxID=2664684 RepID=A0A7I8W6Z8_9ANNE|nr:DgyrCDS12603 [Dimorphilus gyrociliatus]
MVYPETQESGISDIRSYNSTDEGESSPLVNKDDNFQERKIIKPKRTFIVEPLIIMVFVGCYSTPVITNQFVNSVLTSPSNSTENQTCQKNYEKDKGQQKSAEFMLGLSLVQNIPAMFIALFIGPWSDRIGRKPIMYISMIGALCDSLITVLVVSLKLNILYLYIGKTIYGLFGGNNGLTLGAFSYIADITDTDQRSLKIITAEGLMALVAGAAQIGIGYWIKSTNFSQPFFAVFSIYFLSMIYLFFFVPETIYSPKGTNKLKDLFNLKDSKEGFKLFLMSGRRGWVLRLLTAAFLCNYMVFVGRNDANTLFMMSAPLCWNSVEIGIFSGVTIMLVIILGIVWAKIFRTCCSLRLSTMSLIGIISSALMQLVQSVSTKSWMMFIAPFIGSGTFIGFPLIRGYLSLLISRFHQGALFSVVSFIEAIAQLASTSLFDVIYAKTVHVFPGFVFLVASLFCLVGAVFIAIVRCLEINHMDEILMNEENEEITVDA